MVCSLVSISNAAPWCLMKPALPDLVLRELCGGGMRLHTQQAAKNVKAMSRRTGPMMIGGLPEGRSVVKAKAPTKVMLIPASMMHRPHAQHSAGDGRP